MQAIFQFSSVLVLPFWLLMIFAPRLPFTTRLMRSTWVVVPPALLYSALVLPAFLNVFPILANPNLDNIAQLLSSEAGATIAWVHFLAFDLFVGRFVYLDSLEKRIHPVFISVVLFWVLMFGPFGYLLYLGLAWMSKPQSKTATL